MSGSGCMMSSVFSSHHFDLLHLKVNANYITGVMEERFRDIALRIECPVLLVNQWMYGHPAHTPSFASLGIAFPAPHGESPYLSLNHMATSARNNWWVIDIWGSSILNLFNNHQYYNEDREGVWKVQFYEHPKLKNVAAIKISKI